ncbi:MAG TPA: efflux transporter outer membrane subunit [Phycisphaerales bacterium]|nr:efflux transporter outer membrane subunit [Phycisphaerales bacterium]
MKRYWLWGGVATALFVGGCMMAPEYTRPEAPVSADWPQGPAYPEKQSLEGATSAAELTWRQFFSDPNLCQVIAMALEHNRDLRLAALNVERARNLYGVQRAELFPAVYGTGTGSRQRSSADLTFPGQSRTSEVYSVDLGIASWEIDFFGRIRSLEEQALQEYLATEQARRGAQIALVSEVARVYLTLAADRANLNLARSTLEAQQGVYDLIRRQYEVELANDIDLHRAQTQVDAARGDVARYTQWVAQDHNALNLLAGVTVPDDLLPSDLASVSPPGAVAPGLSSEVLFGRPDIMAAEHDLKGAYAFIGAARAAFFPRIGLTTAIGTASDELSGLFESGTGTWNFTPQIAMPIFDSRVWAAHRVSETLRDMALTRYEKTIQTAFREVADVLAVRGTVADQVAAQASVVKSAQTVYDLSLDRYRHGIDSYLNVLDAQRSFYGAQQALISLQLAALVNEVNTYAVLGGGGDVSEAPETPSRR